MIKAKCHVYFNMFGPVIEEGSKAFGTTCIGWLFSNMSWRLFSSDGQDIECPIKNVLKHGNLLMLLVSSITNEYCVDLHLSITFFCYCLSLMDHYDNNLLRIEICFNNKENSIKGKNWIILFVCVDYFSMSWGVQTMVKLVSLCIVCNFCICVDIQWMLPIIVTARPMSRTVWQHTELQSWRWKSRLWILH